MEVQTETQGTKQRVNETPKENPKPKANAADTNGAAAPIASAESPAANIVGFWRDVMTANEEAMRFGIQRAERYQRFFHDMSTCGTRAEAMRICTEAAHHCMDDYVNETEKMAARQVRGPSLTSFFSNAFGQMKAR